MTNIVIIIGCEKQGINLPKHSTNLPSVLLTKYNMQASDTFLRKRQAKNCKHIIYASTKTEEIGAYFRTHILTNRRYAFYMYFLFDTNLRLFLLEVNKI